MRKKRKPSRGKKLNKKRVYTTLTLLFILMLSTISGIIVLYNLSTPLEIFFSPLETSISGDQYVNDTEIYEGNPTNIDYSGANLYVGTVGGEFKSLIKFDISSIPGGVFITDAKLNISIATQVCSVKINISRINKYWNQEYTNWNYSENAVLWTSPLGGGDYETEVIDSLTISSGGNYSFDVTSLVDYWYNNQGDNLGLMMYPGDSSGCLATIKSTQNQTIEDGNLIPKLIVNHVTSRPPTIGTVSSDASTIPTQKSIGEQITFSANWNDNDDATAELFICNTSEISISGCAEKEYCSSQDQPDPAICQYSPTDSDNRTSKFYAGICDLESCSISAENTFYMNHPSNAIIIKPIADEEIPLDTLSYLVQFNISDKDKDSMKADIYWGPIDNPKQNIIVQDLNLVFPNCADPDNDKSTPNNCTYDWDTSSTYQDDVYITVYINDTYSISNYSSDSFDIHTLDDGFPPKITSIFIPSTFYSGEDVTINASARDDESFIKRIWASINTTPETIINLSLYQGENEKGRDGNYSGIFIAVEPGSYKVQIHARDQRNNSVSSAELPFTILKPEITANKATSASTTLPYNVIQISGDIQSATSLKNISALLNVPDGFLFLSETPAYQILGDAAANEQLISNWFLSAPIQEGYYILNITYYDQSFNNWTTDNITIQVTSSIGGGASAPTIDLIGYPVVALDDDYFAEIYFKKSGVLSNANRVEATLYNPQQQIAFGPFEVTDNPSVGEYNLTRTLTTMTGQWELFINITDNLNNYYANQFFTLISGIFDVRSIQIVNPQVNALDISFEAFNKGDIATDLWIFWNLTDSNGNPISGVETSGDETIGVDPGQVITWHIYPKTDYIGQAKITILGKYGASWDKEAGASKTFTILPSGTTPPSDGGSGSGGDGRKDEEVDVTPEDNETTTDEGTGETPQDNETTTPDKTPEKETPLAEYTQPKYWIWIIILLVFLITILLVIIILIYKLYRKQTILSFLEQESKTVSAPQSKNIDFNKRIQDIQNKLK